MPSYGLILPWTTRFLTLAASSSRFSWWIPDVDRVGTMASTSSITTGSNSIFTTPGRNTDASSTDYRDQQSRDRSDVRGRGKWRGRGRGRGRRSDDRREQTDRDSVQDSTADVRSAPPKRPPPPPRPTHFLALPLHNQPSLNSRMRTFHNALFHPSDVTDPLFNNRTAASLNRRPPPKPSSLVEGLDTSIVIDPIRMHMTLGVMALELDEDLPAEGDRLSTRLDTVTKKDESVQSTVMGDSDTSVVSSAQKVVSTATTALTSPGTSPRPRKTIASALALLSSLKPQISEILDGSKGVMIPLETLDVLKTQAMRLPKGKVDKVAGNAEAAGKIEAGEEVKNEVVSLSVPNGEGNGLKDVRSEKVGAGVLFIGPSEFKGDIEDEDRRKLKLVTGLVHKTFRDHGYITDNRPLKLHCSILNASHRRPPKNRGQPFSYTDILALEPALRKLGADPRPPVPTYPDNTDNVTTNEGTMDSSRAGRSDPESLAPPSLMDDAEEGATQLPSSDVLDLEGESRSVPRKPRMPRKAISVPAPLPINLGTYKVDTIELWKMGSFGPDGGYVSCGGIELV